MQETGVHHLILLYVLAKLSLFMFLPLWLFFDIMDILHNPIVPSISSAAMHKILFLLIADGFLNFLQNLVAFTVLSYVTPLSYAIASATKRIFIISASIFLLRNPVTSTNVAGMILAIFGVLAYNKVSFFTILGHRYFEYFLLC